MMDGQQVNIEMKNQRYPHVRKNLWLNVFMSWVVFKLVVDIRVADSYGIL